MTDLGEAKRHCKLHHREDVFLWDCHIFNQISSFPHHISYDFLDIKRMCVFDQIWSFTKCLNTYHVSRLKYVSQVILGQCLILRIRILIFICRTIIVKTCTMNIKYVLSVDLHLYWKCMYHVNLWKGAKQERERSNHSLLNELGPHCLEIVIHSLIYLSGFHQIN